MNSGTMKCSSMAILPTRPPGAVSGSPNEPGGDRATPALASAAPRNRSLRLIVLPPVARRLLPVWGIHSVRWEFASNLIPAIAESLNLPFAHGVREAGCRIGARGCTRKFDSQDRLAD